MNEINVIHGPRLILPFVASPASGHGDGKKPQPDDGRPLDQVEVSAAGAALAAISDSANIRVEKVARVRSEVQNGAYEVEGKLEAVLDRILRDLA